ncbi:hypothetical protein NC653_039816 [Populus alba x Populus x berolinensis]|nr:hypothetical protein NC653_039816 [Populus alba x Populus x berolinensis]
MLSVMHKNISIVSDPVLLEVAVANEHWVNESRKHQTMRPLKLLENGSPKEIVLLILGVPGVIGLGSRGSERDDRGRDRKGHKDDARDESRRGRDGHSSDREERYRGTADGFFLLYLLLFLFIVFQFICINASLTKFL